MSREFRIARDVVVEATPEDVFAAVTTGISGWLFPGPLPAPDGTPDEEGNRVTTWDPPHRFAVRSDGDDGWFNALEYVIAADSGATTSVRYVHSGIFTDDWDGQYDGASTHADYYLHTLGQYVKHFPGRAATYIRATTTAPGANAPTAAETLRRHLGVTAVGDRVHIDIPAIGPLAGEVDYLTEHFLGIRTPDALLRFPSRVKWGMPLTAEHHLYTPNTDTNPDTDPEKTTRAWQSWLDEVFTDRHDQ